MSVGQHKTFETEAKIDFEKILDKGRLERATNWFNKTDTNNNGLISREEFPEKYNHLWDLVDTDKNENLTLEEELTFQIKEQEKEVMRVMCKENRIFTIQKNLKLPSENKKQDISGEWLCFVTMSSYGIPANGIMYINLTQKGILLKGELQQLKFPKREEIRYIDSSENWAADLKGEMILVKGEKPGHNLIVLRRTNRQNNFQAIFSGYIGASSDTIVAQLANSIGNYGTMLMVKRSSLMNQNKRKNRKN